MGAKKVRFYHYLITLIFPPAAYIIVGKPFTFIFNVIFWVPIVYGLCFVFGIGFLLWAISVLGPASYSNIGAWQRLRYWNDGYSVE